MLTLHLNEHTHQQLGNEFNLMIFFFSFNLRSLECYAVEMRRQVFCSGKFISASDLVCTQWSICIEFIAAWQLISVIERVYKHGVACNKMNFMKASPLVFISCWSLGKQGAGSEWGLRKHLLFFDMVLWDASASMTVT